jgi:two-component sensor histidine kinase
MDRFRPIAPYLSAVLATVLTATLAMGLRPYVGPPVPLTIFLIPILVTGYFGNIRAALFAVPLATIAGSYVSFDPVGSFRVDDALDRVRLAAFLLVAGGIAWLTARLARTHRQLAASELRLRDTVRDLHHSQEHQQLLLRELRHRIGNMLATIDSLALQTAHHSRSLPEFQASFSERVRALAKVNDILTSANWAEVPVRDIINSEVSARTLSPSQARVDGPEVLLGPAAALAIHMVIHELCTNAAKYGCLAVSSGELSIHWGFDTDGTRRKFSLVWRESGGPPVEPPSRRGFGSELLEHTVEYELGGEVTLDFLPTGLVCELAFPWSDQLGRVVAEPAASESHSINEVCAA